MLRTTDGGAAWFSRTGPVRGALYSVMFFDAKNGTAVGEARDEQAGVYGAQLLRTTDGGTRSTRQESGTADVLYGISVDPTDATRGIIVGFDAQAENSVSVFLRTTDSGATWSTLPGRAGLALWSVSLAGNGIGGAAGYGGMVLRTTDGGASWYNQTGPVRGPVYNVTFTDSITGTAVGEGADSLGVRFGMILRTIDGARPGLASEAEWTSRSATSAS